MEMNIITILADCICLWTKHFPITTSPGGGSVLVSTTVHKLSLSVRDLGGTK